MTKGYFIFLLYWPQKAHYGVKRHTQNRIKANKKENKKEEDEEN